MKEDVAKKFRKLNHRLFHIEGELKNIDERLDQIFLAMDDKEALKALVQDVKARTAELATAIPK